MKHESYDILARCLAVDDHHHLKEEPEFQEACFAVETSPELQQELEEARSFLKSHPVLIEVDLMPSDVRSRISKALEGSAAKPAPAGQQILGPWQIRSQFAWAACLVLLLGAISVLSSSLIEGQAKKEYNHLLAQQHPEDAFRMEVGRLVAGRFSLDERSDSTTHLVSWLGDQGITGIQVPSEMPDDNVLGCAQFDAPFGKIGVVCFDVEGEVVHMFMTCARDVGLQSPMAPSRFKLNEREALQWSDGDNLYLMIPDQKDADLPEIFL